MVALFQENESRNYKAFWGLNSEVAQCYFHHILLVKTSYKTTSDVRSYKEYVAIFNLSSLGQCWPEPRWWVKTNGQIVIFRIFRRQNWEVLGIVLEQGRDGEVTNDSEILGVGDWWMVVPKTQKEKRKNRFWGEMFPVWVMSRMRCFHTARRRRAGSRWIYRSGKSLGRDT